MEHLFPLPLFLFWPYFLKIAKNHHFLGSHKIEYLESPRMNLDDFFFVEFR